MNLTLSALRFYLDPDPIDAAVALVLAAHRALMGRFAELLAVEEYGGLSEVDVLRMEICRLRQLLVLGA